MNIVIIFNASTPEAKDDIGIGATISKMPTDVLSAIFGVPADTFTKFKKIDHPLLVLRRPPS